MKKVLIVSWLSLFLWTGCGSTDPRTQPPKSRFLKTGETSFVAPEDEEEAQPRDRSASSADRAITRRIRHAILEDKILATAAENVSITTRKGNVSLSGTVHTEKDKTDIGAIAQEVAGVGNVNNQLEVVGY